MMSESPQNEHEDEIESIERMVFSQIPFQYAIEFLNMPMEDRKSVV